MYRNVNYSFMSSVIRFQTWSTWLQSTVQLHCCKILNILVSVRWGIVASRLTSKLDNYNLQIHRGYPWIIERRSPVVNTPA
jgi:hypothetical protein